jgi:hypothetical protein
MKKIIMVIMVTVVCLGTAEVNALIFNDGGVHTIDWKIDEPVWVEDSPTDDPTTLNLVDGGEIVDWLNVFDYSVANIYGGSIGWILHTYEYSQATISGGSIANNLNTSDDSEVFVSGGSIGEEIDVRDYSQVSISGSNFEVDGVPVDYGQITTGTIDGFGRLTGTLTGVLQSGDSLNNFFYIEPDAAIYLVPEPATLLLIGIGALWLRRRNRI